MNHPNTQNDGLFQMIDFNKEFAPSLSTFLQTKVDFLNKGYDYSVVGILGSQSTGKSTLLNVLFGCGFAILDSEKIGQQTLGIWLGLSSTTASEGANTETILVLDVEGVDSGERKKQQDENFDKQTSLYSLALCSVLLINMKSDDVGRNAGANLPILKIIFELNLQLFQSDLSMKKTLLLFVLRDQTPNRPFEQADLDDIWRQLVKPDKFANSKISDFFDLDFVGLSHKIYAQDKFEQETEALKSRFVDRSNPEFLLKPAYKRGIPADGFCQYAGQVWDVVKTNKDLDLPDQFRLLAQYRCSEIADALAAGFDQTIAEATDAVLDSQNERGLATLGKTIGAAVDSLLESFTTQTKLYHKEEVEKKRTELTALLTRKYEIVFRKNLNVAKKFALEQFIDALEAAVSGTAPLENFYETVDRLAQAASDSWHKVAAASTVPALLLSAEDSAKELSDALQLYINAERANQMKKVADFIKRNLDSDLRVPIEKQLNVAGPAMWANIRRVHESRAEELFGPDGWLAKFASSLRSSKEEAKSMQAQVRSSLQDLVRTALREKARALPGLLEKRFDQNFNWTDGQKRRWTPDDNIDAFAATARQMTLPLIDQLALVRLNPELDSVVWFSPDDSFEAPRGLPGDIVVLQYQECYELVENFDREIQRLVEVARHQAESTQIGALPPWAIPVFLLFSANEIIWLLTNPFALPLFIIVATTALVIHKTGSWPLLKPFVMPHLTTLFTVLNSLDIRNFLKAPENPPAEAALAADKEKVKEPEEKKKH